MPLPLLSAYVQMLSRLEAEESLARVAEAQASDPYIDGESRAKLIGSWQERANVEDSRPELTIEQRKMEMALLGITIEEV